MITALRFVANAHPIYEVVQNMVRSRYAHVAANVLLLSVLVLLHVNRMLFEHSLFAHALYDTMTMRDSSYADLFYCPSSACQLSLSVTKTFQCMLRCSELVVLRAMNSACARIEENPDLCTA